MEIWSDKCWALWCRTVAWSDGRGRRIQSRLAGRRGKQHCLSGLIAAMLLLRVKPVYTVLWIYDQVQPAFESCLPRSLQLISSNLCTSSIKLKKELYKWGSVLYSWWICSVIHRSSFDRTGNEFDIWQNWQWHSLVDSWHLLISG